MHPDGTYEGMHKYQNQVFYLQDRMEGNTIKTHQLF